MIETIFCSKFWNLSYWSLFVIWCLEFGTYPRIFNLSEIVCGIGQWLKFSEPL
jgi:hypothetical protein